MEPERGVKFGPAHHATSHLGLARNLDGSPSGPSWAGSKRPDLKTISSMTIASISNRRWITAGNTWVSVLTC